MGGKGDDDDFTHTHTHMYRKREIGARVLLLLLSPLTTIKGLVNIENKTEAPTDIERSAPIILDHCTTSRLPS